MTEAITAATAPLPAFTTVKYTTKDGENITATKKDGVVTLVGDKNGTRQLPLDDFIKKELPENLENVKLENTPEKDSVEISKPADATTKTTPIEKGTEEIAKAETPEVGKKLDLVA